MYLNQFDFLYNAVGIRSAAFTYFGKTPAELNLQESAMLIGMCKNPSIYNPILRANSPLPMERRNHRLPATMEKAGYLTEREVRLPLTPPHQDVLPPHGPQAGYSPLLP